MISEIIELIEKLVELWEKNDDVDSYRADVTALLSKIVPIEKVKDDLVKELIHDSVNR